MPAITLNPGFVLALAALIMLAAPQRVRPSIMAGAAAIAMWLMLDREFGAAAAVAQMGLTVVLLNLDAKFTLTRISDNKMVLEGTSFGRAAFERFTAIYANVRAKEDAENRAARAVAEDLKGRLAGFLATN